MAIIRVVARLLTFSLLLFKCSQAAYSDSSTCAQSRPGVPNCRGEGTSDLSDYIGNLFNGNENYALISHPFGIYILVAVDYVWFPGTASDLFTNGVSGFIINIQNKYYFLSTVGCGPFIELPNTDELVYGTRTLTYHQLSIGVLILNDRYSRPCNVFTTRHLVGPFPDESTKLTGANYLIHTTSLQSAVIYPQNGTNIAFEAGAKQLLSAQKLKVDIQCGLGGSVYLTQSGFPNSPPCVPQAVNIFDGSVIADTPAVISAVKSLQPNSACVLATAIAQAFADTNISPNLYTYTGIAIFKRDEEAVTKVAGYIRTTFFDNISTDLFDTC